MPDAPFPTLVSRLRDLAADPGDGTSDADLLRRFTRDRDPVAFEALVWRHARLVMGACRRMLRHHQDAEDAFQAVFLLLARKGHRIRRGAALPAWLHTTAVRVARRARSRRRPVPVPEVPERPTSDPPPESVEALAVLDEEVRRLPVRLRATFVLCALEGRTHADAARELGCPKGTVDSRMRAAKRRLQAALSRRGLTLTSLAAAAVVPELAHSDAARRAAVVGLGRPADVSSGVAGLLTPTGGGRWLVGLAALTLATFGSLATLSGTAGTDDPAKKAANPPDEGPKVAAGERRVPVTTPLFKRTTIGLPPGDELDGSFKVSADWLTRRYETFAATRRDGAQPLIPPAVPQCGHSLVIYANDKGVGAIGLESQKAREVAIVRGELYWNSDASWSLISWAREPGSRTTLDQFLDLQTADSRAQLAFHRTLSTSFALHDRSVLAIEELGFLPPPQPRKEGGIPPQFGAFNEVMNQNQVRVVDLDSGKISGRLAWRVAVGTWPPVSPLEGTQYLGPPIVTGAHLSALNQLGRQVRLTSLDWEPFTHLGRAVDQKKARTAWDTELAVAPRSVIEDPYRRIHAIHLVRAGDLIVCPTHLGRVVAVDAKTGQKKWTHEYAPLDAKRFPTFAPE